MKWNQNDYYRLGATIRVMNTALGWPLIMISSNITGIFGRLLVDFYLLHKHVFTVGILAFAIGYIFN